MKLSEINKENPFTVPENYFNNFKVNIPEYEKVKNKNKTLKFYLNPILKVAAILLLGLILVKPLNVTESDTNNITYEAYYDSNDSDYGDYEDMLVICSGMSDYDIFEALYGDDN